MNGLPLFMWYALLVAAILTLVSSIDELFLDLTFWWYKIYRLWKFKRYHYQPLSYDQLLVIPEKRIAIMIPCWHEEQVIGNMLKHNIPSINYQNYDIFVGVYPNDLPTIEAVQNVQKIFPNVYCVIGQDPGPTTKAANLNGVYKYILAFEKANQVKYDVFVFHDSEDIIYPASLKVFTYLIPRKDMIQVPVYPLEVSSTYTTHWTYNDEFAENHTRFMIVREAIGGFIPSAGVGTAFSRMALELLTLENRGEPFNTKTFTEDYSVALRIHMLDLSAIFLLQKIERIQTKKKWIFFGKLVPKKVQEHIATRALFPTRYMDAVRQRTRWITGIIFQEWSATGWCGNFATRYTLFHDRKASVTHIINFVAYLIFIFWLVYYFMGLEPTINQMLAQNSFAFYLILTTTLVMIFRLFQRAISTYTIYGFFPAILSIPRAIYSNIINFHAIMRAYRIYFFTHPEKSKWDKTRNVFPTTAQLRKYRQKMGDLLLEKRIITSQQLEASLNEQKQTREKLGNILLRRHLVKPDDILEVLAKQYDLDIVDINSFRILSKEALESVSSENYLWLLTYKLLPIAYANGVITLAIHDPSQEAIQKEATIRMEPLKIKFVLSSNAVSG